MKEIPSVIYETIDGKRFISRKEAELHESQLTDVKGFLVRYAPDLTEGRGWQKEGIVLVHAKRHQLWFAEHYCYEKFGNRIEFIMGAYGSNAITENWSVREVNIDSQKKQPILAKLEEDFITKIWNDSTKRR
jgi:hypothetical protein